MLLKLALNTINKKHTQEVLCLVSGSNIKVTLINTIKFYCTCIKTTLFKNVTLGTALTTILPILFLYLNTVAVTAGTFEP